MPTKLSTPAADVAIQKIPLNKIIPSPFQTRKDFDPQKLQELASTLKVHGLLNAIVVRKAGGKFELIAGERRVRAAKTLGWAVIDAKIQNVDDKEAAQQVVVENLQRDDLNPIEQAEGYKKLQDMGMSQTQIAKEVGVSQPAIAQFLGLLELPAEVKSFITRVIISVGQVRILNRIKDKNLLIRTTRLAASQGWSVKETERRVGEMLHQNGRKPDSSAEGRRGDRQRDVAKADVRWEGEEIVINMRFRPVEETLEQFLAKLNRLITPMLLAMPGLKDSPKSSRARAAAVGKMAAAANADVQALVDQAFNKMSPAQIEALQKDFKEGAARAERENAASSAKIRAQMEKDLQANREKS